MVDYQRSAARVENGVMVVHLSKNEGRVWGSLVAKGSKTDLKRRREESMERRQKQDEEVQFYTPCDQM
jgi:hypothetical protein